MERDFVEQELRMWMNDERIMRWANAHGHQLSVGLTGPEGRFTWRSGNESADVPSPGLYEIGSITKTMTGLLLAVGEDKGWWMRSSLVSELEPAWAASPFASSTTLLQLATHNSGLPRIPGNLRAALTDKQNPYVSYGDAELHQAIGAEKLPRRRPHLYSNYGYGLLGWLLAKKLGSSYEQALLEHVLHPLGLHESAIGTPGSEQARLVPVFKSQGQPASHWEFQGTTAGAGAVRSTLSDMLKYVEAHLERDERRPLSAALALCRSEHHAIFASRGVGIGYAWMRYHEKDGSVTHWHNGGTYGSSSFTAFNIDKGRGFVILSNYGLDPISQLPFFGRNRMNTDRLARRLSDKLFG